MTEPTTPGWSTPEQGTTVGAKGARLLPSGPDASHPVPEPLTRRFGDRIEQVVWVNEVGGVTVRADAGGASVYAKWAPPRSELDLRAEVERLAWAAPYVRVPRVLDFTSDADGDVLVTAAIPGENAASERWRAEPAQAVRAIAVGLRQLHDALPVPECPFSWSVDERMARSRNEGIRERILALDRLPRVPAVDRLVVCHADACVPNTLLADDGSVAGHVDLGRLGVADRWADIAIGAWSTEWNYGPGYTDLFYQSYGVEADEERIAFYRALWDAT
ncbi:aminoglycoside 3'-phosphotransferase [Humibacter ginsenosidimutans]|uniref:Aminoglycoside 3'-phosphotransferase n=1 Tax=Humibacter ginsenosidimutans TaxID=2599293 RepID=A0A5B8M1N4_9MICO|nr:aminoglycoside 3'-phosphotransferase [Humibacter ginsenosidimutans]QDZ13951.1 aminoglycoside 3'-phosphotransferase [Humibacter ginsenosidimutans]